jgi:formylglycine-generating enzyme required for sulfatase activity
MRMKTMIQRMNPQRSGCGARDRKGVSGSLSALVAVWLICLVTLSLIACGGNEGIGADLDASDLDADLDASAPDAADPDEDGDGYPASEDCDDTDDSIHPGATRECESDCDHGTETCLDTGEWSDCTAITDCECDTPGETRLVDCEKCGQASQECGSDLKWSYPGECLNQGECGPGAVDTAACEFLGEKQRLCSSECEWGEWDESACSECEPGTSEVTNEGCPQLGQIQERECDSDGNWVALTSCTADCILPARTGTDDYKDEICIPGGPFIMGSDPGEGHADERPEHEVILTPYFIDKYEVTCGRYQECVDAGVCVENFHCRPEESHYPSTSVSHDEAETFCQWDGGRTLPTEAQWEKAARGPSPREVPYPWGWDEPTCELTLANECLPYSEEAYPVDSKPAGVSYYGVFQMAGNVNELCADRYDPNYYDTSPLVDPTGPSNAADRVLRGRHTLHTLQDFASGPVVTLRTTTREVEGFRCARRAY